MSPLIDIPGIVSVVVKIDYNQYQQFMTIAHNYLKSEGMILNLAEFNNRIVEDAITKTVQEMVKAAFIAAKPEVVVELLQDNAKIAHKNLSSRLIVPVAPFLGTKGK